MYLEEVMPALRAGKRIQHVDGPRETVCLRPAHVFGGAFSPDELLSNNWSIAEDPATDEELAAAFEARAKLYTSATHQELQRAADMVRNRYAHKRYADPSWKAWK